MSPSAASSNPGWASSLLCTACSATPTSRYCELYDDRPPRTRRSDLPDEHERREPPMLLNRDDWYETSRDLDWTLSYADPRSRSPLAGAAPRASRRRRGRPGMSRSASVPRRRPDPAGEGGRGQGGQPGPRPGPDDEKLDPAHVAASHLHMGTTCMVEPSVTMQSRLCRFAPTPKWRNLGVFGMLDETRHTQLDMRFSHDLLKADPAFRLGAEGIPHQRVGCARGQELLRRRDAERRLR